MLTGDKLETAINIGFSCRVLSASTEIVRVELTDPKKLAVFFQQTLLAILKTKEFLKTKENNQEGLFGLDKNAQTLNYAVVIEGASLFKIQ